jgi:DNA-binding NtrC family response regulator
MTTTDGDAAAQQTVLVVDDEVLVRMAIAAYLRDCGYRVVEAANAEEAKLVIEHDEEGAVSVVLSSLVVDGDQGGFVLARWIRDHRPGCQVVLAGSPARAAQAAGDICEQGPMLRKPYEPQLVLDRIRRLLARRPPQA